MTLSDSSAPFTKKFARRRENFICEICHISVEGNGYTNHCPQCLYSKHVDINPGDRASTCKGLLKPLSKGLDKKGYFILHQCLKCHEIKRIKILSEDNKNIIHTLPWA